MMSTLIMMCFQMGTEFQLEQIVISPLLCVYIVQSYCFRFSTQILNHVIVFKEEPLLLILVQFVMIFCVKSVTLPPYQLALSVWKMHKIWLIVSVFPATTLMIIQFLWNARNVHQVAKHALAKHNAQPALYLQLDCLQNRTVHALVDTFKLDKINVLNVRLYVNSVKEEQANVLNVMRKKI